MNHTKKMLPLLLFTCALLLTACAPAGGQEEDVTTLICANLTKNNNREDYDTVRRVAQSNGFSPKMKGFGQEPDAFRVECHRVTDEEWERYETLINSITKVDMYDSNIYTIVWEAAGAYFAGDKTLDETVDMIRNRVSLYVNENR